MINVNVLGVFTTIHTCFPLLKNGAPNSLAFSTSSSSAMYGMPGIVSYSASKHGWYLMCFGDLFGELALVFEELGEARELNSTSLDDSLVLRSFPSHGPSLPRIISLTPPFRPPSDLQPSRE